MKLNLILIPVFAILVGCGTSKSTVEPVNNNQPVSEQTENTEENEQVDENNSQQLGISMSEGIVRDKSGEGCGFVIEILVNNVSNESSYLEPLPLPKELQVDGTPIRFTYNMSRRASKCTIASPIIIQKILE